MNESHLLLLEGCDPRLEVPLLLLQLLLALPVPLHQVCLRVRQLLLLLAHLFMLNDLNKNQIILFCFFLNRNNDLLSAQRPPPSPSPS